MKPYYEDNHIRIFNKDCRDMSELPDESVDLLVTDPPYGISFMGKDWDTFNEVVPPQGAYQHKKGFKKLPRQSTQSMAEFFIPIWKECLRILKSGAFAFVMCSPRADVMAKQVICLQEAGFEVGFTPIYHAFAQGFPKAQNIGKAVDKRLGNEREVVGKGKAGAGMNKVKGFGVNTTKGGEATTEWDETKGNSPLEGSYAGFQPKPAVEVIIVAMKPLSEKTFVDQALKNRRGITWLDDCRIPIDKEADRTQIRTMNRGVRPPDDGWGLNENEPDKPQVVSPKGRFPANLLVSDDVLNDGRITKSSQYPYRAKGAHPGHWEEEDGSETQGYTDSGSFSRYFDLDKWWAKAFPFLIVPKASKSEKDKGLEMPQVIKSGLPLRDGSGDYVENVAGDGSQSTRRTRAKNVHPTVKPVKLMAYLITLGSREGDTVLDNFSGSGTTAVAASLLGRRCIMYEIDEQYCEMAVNRCRQMVLGL